MDRQYFNENFSFKLIKNNKMAKKRKFVIVKPKSHAKLQIDEINKIILKDKNVDFNNKKNIIAGIDNFIQQNLKEYTVVRCDFKNYYNSLNINYIIEKCELNSLLNEKQQIFLKDYADFLKYCRPGINLNTTLSEVIAEEFDKELKSTYRDIVLYIRFVDDIFMIMDKKVDEGEIKFRLSSTIEKVFYDKNINYKNKTQIPFDRKFEFFNSEQLPKSINYLDMKIDFFDKITISVGYKEKDKFNEQLKKVILKYHNNDRAMKTILKILAKGVIYKEIKNHKVKWAYKGYVSKYRFYSKVTNFNKDEHFCQNVFKNAFIKLNLPVPSYLNEKCYDIIDNVKNKRYFVLDKTRGIPREKLLKIMENLGEKYDNNAKYFDIAKNLIKICMFY